MKPALLNSDELLWLERKHDLAVLLLLLLLVHIRMYCTLLYKGNITCITLKKQAGFALE